MCAVYCLACSCGPAPKLVLLYTSSRPKVCSRERVQFYGCPPAFFTCNFNVGLFSPMSCTDLLNSAEEHLACCCAVIFKCVYPAESI